MHKTLQNIMFCVTTEPIFNLAYDNNSSPFDRGDNFPMPVVENWVA